MSSGRSLSLALMLLFLPAAAYAQFEAAIEVMELPPAVPGGAWRGGPPGGMFGRPRGGGMWIMPDGSVRTTRFRPKRVPSEPVWKIPSGKYGLEIKGNLRMIGRPAKDWSATLKTGFGTVTIPLTKITKLEPAGDGRFAAHLKNGDRVTGELISKTLPFKTDFGTLSVPSSDLVRLSTAPPVKPTVPTTTSGRGKTTSPPVPIKTDKLPDPFDG